MWICRQYYFNKIKYIKNWGGGEGLLCMCIFWVWFIDFFAYGFPCLCVCLYFTMNRIYSGASCHLLILFVYGFPCLYVCLYFAMNRIYSGASKPMRYSKFVGVSVCVILPPFTVFSLGLCSGSMQDCMLHQHSTFQVLAISLCFTCWQRFFLLRVMCVEVEVWCVHVTGSTFFGDWKKSLMLFFPY